MKKAKLMIGVLTLSAVLLGTGYAAWTDAITFGGTVTTGEFCVQYDGQPKFQHTTMDEATFKTQNEIKEMSASLVTPTGTNSHNITFSITNLKPNVPVTYTTTIQNLSSVKAQLGTIEIKEGGSLDNIHLTIKLGDNTAYAGLLNAADSDKKLPGIILAADDKDYTNGTDEIPVTFIYELKGDTDQHKAETIKFTAQINWSQETK